MDVSERHYLVHWSCSICHQLGVTTQLRIYTRNFCHSAGHAKALAPPEVVVTNLNELTVQHRYFSFFIVTRRPLLLLISAVALVRHILRDTLFTFYIFELNRFINYRITWPDNTTGAWVLGCSVHILQYLWCFVVPRTYYINDENNEFVFLFPITHERECVLLLLLIITALSSRSIRGCCAQVKRRRGKCSSRCRRWHRSR